MTSIKENNIIHSLIETVMTIILSASLGSTFISVLYFTFGNYIEELMVVKNIKYILDSFCILNDPLIKNNLKQSINQLQPPAVGKDDNEVIDIQNKIKTQAFYFYGKINIAVVITILVLSFVFNIELSEIIIKSLTLLLGIAIVEVFFLCFVTYNFIMAQPNKTIVQILEAPQLQVNLNDDTKLPSIVNELNILRKNKIKIPSISDLYSSSIINSNLKF
jgi:hypothetical protein